MNVPSLATVPGVTGLETTEALASRHGWRGGPMRFVERLMSCSSNRAPDRIASLGVVARPCHDSREL
jgi:hypothetical protein